MWLLLPNQDEIKWMNSIFDILFGLAFILSIFGAKNTNVLMYIKNSRYQIDNFHPKLKTQSRWTKWLCMWQSFNHKYWTPRFSSWSFLNDHPPQLTTALAPWPQSSEHLSCSSSPKRVVIDWFLIAICRVHRKWNDNLNGAFCSLNVSN